MRSPLTVLTLASLAGGLLACGGAPLEEALEAPGRWNVGYRELTFEYERPDGGGAREIVVLVWYPTEATEGTAPRYPFASAPRAFEGAPPAAGPFPVFAYSHGHQAVPGASTFLMEHLASHGYVAFAPRHTGNTTLDGGDRRTEIYYLRSHDVSESWDHLRASAPFAGVVGERGVISGHSFGGYTAYSLLGAVYDVEHIETGCPAGEVSSDICDELDQDALDRFAAGLADPRFVAGVSMAAGDFGLFGEAGVRALERPVLQMVAELDGHPPGAASSDRYWAALDGADDVRVNLLGAHHNSFTDICRRFPSFLQCPGGPSADQIENERVVRIYALAFARAHLEADAAARAFLASATVVGPRVEIDTRIP
ncbi:MAG: hypothetical protein KF901_09780 [Myxococcales bacterium]|nr:hypothetical protein [Myxococcales bacterium]